MLSLKDFKENVLNINSLTYVKGGQAGDDTPGGVTAFGKSEPSSCDIDNGDGTQDHYYGDEGWVTFYAEE